MSSSDLKMSDPVNKGVGKLIDALNLCEIKNKDFVIPHNELYLYLNLLNKIKEVAPDRSRWDWDGMTVSKDCPF